MLSYQKWKLYNESFGATSFNLGIKTPTSMGIVGANTTELGTELDEKKMLGTVDLADKKPLLPLPKDKKPLNKDLEGDEEVVDDKDVADDIGDEDKDVGTEDDLETDLDVAKDPDEDSAEKSTDLEIMPKKGTIVQKCKKCATMRKEDQNWWNSVHSMLDPETMNQRFSSGLSEDMLIALSGTPEATTDDQTPGPGEVGFAPQARIGNL